MRVFITGIDGMLGNAIARYHLDRGDLIDGCDIWKTTPPRWQGNILDESLMRTKITSFNPDRIYHCAAMLGVQNTEMFPTMCRAVNEDGTLIIARIAAEIGAHLVFTSSSEVYGDQSERLSEKSPLRGSNVYAVSKRNGEDHCHEFHDRIPVTICRMFNCYGPLQVRQFFLPKTVERAMANQDIPLYGNGNNVRSYLLSFDAAVHIVQVADASVTYSFSVCNVGSDETVTLHEAASAVIDRVGSQSHIIIRDGDVYDDRERSRDIPNRLADVSKLRGLSKHRPQTFLQGLECLVRLFPTTRPDWDYARDIL